MLSGIHAYAYCKSKNYDGQIMSNETSRAAFEAHIDDCIESEVGLEQALVKDGFGDYCVPWVSSKWNAWQASREVALEQAAEVCDALKSAYQDISKSTLLTVNGKTVHQGMFGGAHNCAAAIRSMK
jgi:hypothetical protein